MDNVFYSNFMVSVNAVLPMALLMLLGMLIRHQDWLNGQELKRVNGVIFKVFFFFMLFNSTYHATINDYRPRLLVYGLVAVLILWVLSWVFSCAVAKDGATRGALIQNLYRSNFVILGYPLVVNMFGYENSGVTAMMVAVIVPFYNVLAVITLEYFRGGNANMKKMIKEVLLNPMVLGFLSAGALRLVGVVLPTFMDKLVTQLGLMTSPLAIIVLGASFSGMGKPKWCYVLISVVGRLLVVPTVGLTISYWMGFRGIEFATLLVMFGAPTAVISYAMAQLMDSDDVLAGNAVVYSTALSCFTLFCWIFIWKTIGAF